MDKQKLNEGAIVYVQGFEMTVTNLRVIYHGDTPVARFNGVCTDSDRNKSIKGTAYDGGTYGGNHLAYDFDVPLKLSGSVGPTAPLSERSL